MSVQPASLRNLRPPWKPGQSGNPAGRPRCGSVSLFRAWRAVQRGDTETVRRFLSESSSGPEFRAMVSDPRASGPRAIPCSVCSHQQRAVLDALLAIGAPLRSLAASYGLSRSALHRHSKSHTPTFPLAAQAQQVLEAEAVLPRILEVMRKLAFSTGRQLVEVHEEAVAVLSNSLWALLGTGPRDTLVSGIIVALWHLGIIRGHILASSDVIEARAALAALESWGGTNFGE